MIIGIVAFLAPGVCFAYRVGDVDLELKASASEAYDDNITFVNTEEKKDSSTNLNLGLDGNYVGKTRSLYFSVNLNHQIFDTYSNYDNTSENLSLAYLQEFSKYSRISLKDSFTHSEEPRSFEDEFGRTSGRYSTNRNKFNAEFTRDYSQKFRLIWRYSYEIYDPSRSDLSSSYQNKLGAEADYAFNSQTIGYVTYDFSQRNFDPGSEATFNILGAGLRQYFTSQFYADARFGLDLINSYDERNYAKPFFFLSLSDEFDPTSKLTVSLVKEYTANAYTQDLFNYWQISASLTKQVFQRLRLGLNVFTGEGKYNSLGIEDKLKGLSLGLDYDLLHNLTAKLQYSYSQTESNFESREYTRNFISLGLRYAF